MNFHYTCKKTHISQLLISLIKWKPDIEDIHLTQNKIYQHTSKSSVLDVRLERSGN